MANNRVSGGIKRNSRDGRLGSGPKPSLIRRRYGMSAIRLAMAPKMKIIPAPGTNNPTAKSLEIRYAARSAWELA